MFLYFFQVDFWSEPSEAGRPVEINVGRQHFVKLSKGLKRRGMKYELYIDDVQKAIDNENKGTQHLFSSIGFDYAKYNTLSSVSLFCQTRPLVERKLSWIDLN